MSKRDDVPTIYSIKYIVRKLWIRELSILGEHENPAWQGIRIAIDGARCEDSHGRSCGHRVEEEECVIVNLVQHRLDILYRPSK